MNDFSKRFEGIIRLLGEEATEKLAKSHICVVGIGGVGSWAVEAFARSGIGNLTIVDFDDICKSNTNRQVHALENTFHKPKTEEMAKRIKTINPYCNVNPLQMFFTQSTAETILGTKYDYVVDAIDSPSKKCLLISMCKKAAIPVITTGAAAGRKDPTLIKIADLSVVSHDRLLQEVRKKLRVKYGFPRPPLPMDVEAVYSTEEQSNSNSAQCGNKTEHINSDNEKPESECVVGYGTAVFVTGTFGFVAAARVIQKLCAINKNMNPAN